MSIQRLSIFALCCMGMIASINTPWAKFIFFQLKGTLLKDAGYYTLALFGIAAILTWIGQRQMPLSKNISNLVKLFLLFAFVVSGYVVFKATSMFAVKPSWGLYSTTGLAFLGLINTFLFNKKVETKE